MTVDLYNYTCSDKGLLLPIISEYTWSIEVRAFLYVVAMLWFFLGIAIVADVFMTGIENITSKMRIIRVPNPETEGCVKEIKVKVWNDTVANLSLMAFGTSAPEILLSVIEICGKGFKAGELGPGTIVGSAAYNLLIITAICIVCIPKGEVRSIKNMRVYITTSIFSMFAYIWIVIVLLLSSPEVIELWEAIITFLMFPTLLIVSYLADKRCCWRHNKTSSEVELGIDLYSKDTESCSDIHIIHLARQLGELNELSEEEAANIALAKLSEQQTHNHGWYRINAMRKITSGHRLVPHMNDRFKELSKKIDVECQLKELSSVPNVSVIDLIENEDKVMVEFTAVECAVMENEGKVRIGIRRSGNVNSEVTVWAETIDGSAQAIEDYIPFNMAVTFPRNEISQDIYVDIVDDNIWEPDEYFYVKLYVQQANQNGSDIVLGKTSITRVTIINDDDFFFFKFQVLFACIPPPSIGGGWLTFFFSLFVIGIMTAIVGDLASLFGCLVGLSDTITAITFVALGTSMPDTFASKQAALGEKYADSSIGNVNGSNAVNVFLGLGLPWLIASIYWTIQGSTFVVPRGDIATSVIIYLLAATLAIIILAIRRHFTFFGCAELGGPRGPKMFTAFLIFILWILYIVLSSLNSSGTININVH
ncbi:hypothetical protein ACJMK2_034325 [Sinanodonta woodiana]|uniref:Calx-beta domain-containing protein n=1 Tax=Sinanodonta woodiana TaxID=1069815 RepID=A0ABD3WR74_SINWO